MIKRKKNKIKVLGTLLCIITAYFSIEISNIIGKNTFGFEKSPISPIIIAIIVGIIFSNLNISFVSRLKPGYDFCIRRFLKLGIILLGIRISLIDFVLYGFKALIVVIPCIIITIFLVKSLSNRFKISLNLSLLIAVGTSICGATAIAALAPSINAKKTEITYAIANITVFGIFAMFLYPVISKSIFLNDSLSVGLFLGSSIHETAQVAGSAMIYNTQYQNQDVVGIATVTKLLRNTLMVFVIPYLAQKVVTNDNKKNRLGDIFPYFVLGFISFGLIRTVGDYLYGDFYSWSLFIEITKYAAEFLLITSMSAIGYNTALKNFGELGLKPFTIGLIAALTVSISSAGVIIISNYLNILTNS